MKSALPISRAARQPLFALLVAVLSLTTPGAAANLDQLMQDFRVTRAGPKPAPAFTLATLGGKPTTLTAQRGRPVLLYFWATW
ncbi:MAG: TlpA family protein disulfide reductase [Candidatus Rokuibacteriota bacterium]